MRFFAFLAVNACPDVSALCARLDEYAELGLDGVVWHPRNYPAEPAYLGDEYLAALSAAILHARELGLSVWIYDENGWPSGSCDGRVAEAVPDSLVRWLAFENGGVIVREQAGLSTFSRACTDAFIRLTHERYRTGLDPEAFAHVEAFFSDEVRFSNGPGSTPAGILPWPPEVEHKLAERGLSTDPAALRGLFKGDSEAIRALRVTYWESLTDCLVEGFYQPIRAWCDAHGKRYAAHLKGEEDPFFQIGYSGSALTVLEGLSIPGVDALERDPHNCYYPRLASSAAAQAGSGRSMCEAFGGAGNGASAADLARYVRWVGGCGVSDVVIHIDQLRLDAAAMRDWPASIPTHMTWRPVFRSLLDSLRDADAAPAVRRGNDTVVVVPMRAIQECFTPDQLADINTHDGENEPNTAAVRMSDAVVSLMDEAAALGFSPQLVEERLLERGARVEGRELVVGHARYRRVVAFGEAFGSPAVARLLTEYENAGGEVLTPAELLAGLGKVTTSFVGMPETLALGGLAAEFSSEAGEDTAGSAGTAGAPAAPGAEAALGAATVDAGVAGVEDTVGVPAQTPWRVTPPTVNLVKLEPRVHEADDEDEADDGDEASATKAESSEVSATKTESSEAFAIEAESCEAATEEPGLGMGDVASSGQAAGPVARVPFASDLSAAGCFLVLSDDVARLTWDGVELTVSNNAELAAAQGLDRCLVAELPSTACSAGVHELRVIAGDEPEPACYLVGRFAVRARFWPFDGRQVTSDGTYELYGEDELSELPYDLLESGYPFSFLPVTLAKTVTVGRSGTYRLALTDVHAAAARVRVDGGEAHDVWAPDFETDELELAAGEHEVSVELYNSTYNVLGPHHYYRGDVSCVTPAQFAGTRNFADPSHAPARTSIDFWHFVHWGLGEDVELRPA